MGWFSHPNKDGLKHQIKFNIMQVKIINQYYMILDVRRFITKVLYTAWVEASSSLIGILLKAIRKTLELLIH